jgi:hypothetical protein
VEIILRDVSSLARACAEKAQEIVERFSTIGPLRLSAHINYDVEEVLRDASTQALTDIDDVTDLYWARWKLRALNAKFNTPTVTDLLAEREGYLDSMMPALEDTYLRMARIVRTCEHEAKQVSERLEGLRQRMATVTGEMIRDTIEVPRLSATDAARIENKLAAMRIRRRTIGREMALENMRISLTIPEELERILRKHKIIE